MRIAAAAAVPLVLAGGAAAIRTWHAGGETAATSSPAAFAAEPTPAATAASGPDARSSAEAASAAASVRPTPRAPEPTPSRAAERTDGAGASAAATAKRTGKPAASASPGSSTAPRGEHPSGGRSGTWWPDDGPEEDEPGVLRPADGTDTATDALRLPDVLAPAGDAPGRTEPGDPASGGAGRDDDPMAYFQARWDRDDAAMKKVTDIRLLGGYLRVYTKLPDTAVNHRHAVKLCKRGRDYLATEHGVRHPVVFVHARRGLNGNPVLANDLGAADKDCRLTTPRPARGGGKRS